MEKRRDQRGEEVERMKKWGGKVSVVEKLSKISSCCPHTNGAPATNAPLVIKVTNGAFKVAAPLKVLQKKNILMAH